jgi:uncharacterized protein YjgD (DUF1641 family)
MAYMDQEKKAKIAENLSEVIYEIKGLYDQLIDLTCDERNNGTLDPECDIIASRINDLFDTVTGRFNKKVLTISLQNVGKTN